MLEILAIKASIVLIAWIPVIASVGGTALFLKSAKVFMDAPDTIQDIKKSH